MSRPDYVMDVPYIRSFMDDLSPARLRLVAALNGFPPPPAEDFDYCDLGAGHGDTTATLAAAYPRARFVGVDLNPDHVATARVLVASGGLTNAHFVEHDFTELGDQDLPSFDYICAHGVLSWIAPETRAAMLTAASAKLKPGGLLYVGYNSLPGWAAVEPLRRLLSDRASAVEGDSRERARAALHLAKQLAGVGSRYFTRNPPAMDMLATMEKGGLTYIVHEYLHAYWVPMYFADVAREMAERDLYFVGQLPVYLNYRDLAVSPAAAELFKDITDRITLETLMAYALNQFFRREVYVKGRSTRADTVTHAYLDATPFAPLVHGGIARTVKMAHHTLEFVGEVFDALLPMMEEGAARVSDLAARPELARYRVERVRHAVLQLIISGQVAPLLYPTKAAPPPEGRCRVPSAYNRTVLHRPLSADAPFALASPVAGTGIVLSLLQVVALRLLTEVEPSDWPRWIHTLAGQQSFALLSGSGRTTEGAPTETAVLHEVEQVRSRQLGKLTELGVLETCEDRPPSI
jgi:trans-aconitate methyltransferase